MRKKIIILNGVLLMTLIGFFYLKNKNSKTKVNNKSSSEYIVSDSIKKARSEEIKTALNNENNEFSPLDYAFMIEELKEMNSEDTLFYAFTPTMAMLSNSVSDSIFFGSNLSSYSIKNPDSKYVYWTMATTGNQPSQNQYVLDVVGMEQLFTSMQDSSQLNVSSSPLNNYFLNYSKNNKIDITKIPDQYLEYDLIQLEQNIKDFAFSEVVGEEEIMEFLIKDTENTLKIIEKDSSLITSFNYWLEDLDALYYSNDYPAEIPARKLDFLIEQLKKSKHPFAESTWKTLDKVEIVKID